MIVAMAVTAIGLLGVAAPRKMVGLLSSWRIVTGLPVTVSLRIGLGTLFLVAAPACRLPELVRLVGFGELVAAVVLLMFGAGRLRRFVAWWLERPVVFVRCWCSGALVLGVLLVYSGA